MPLPLLPSPPPPPMFLLPYSRTIATCKLSLAQRVVRFMRVVFSFHQNKNTFHCFQTCINPLMLSYFQPSIDLNMFSEVTSNAYIFQVDRSVLKAECYAVFRLPKDTHCESGCRPLARFSISLLISYFRFVFVRFRFFSIFCCAVLNARVSMK